MSVESLAEPAGFPPLLDRRLFSTVLILSAEKKMSIGQAAHFYRDFYRILGEIPDSCEMLGVRRWGTTTCRRERVKKVGQGMDGGGPAVRLFFPQVDIDQAQFGRVSHQVHGAVEIEFFPKSAMPEIQSPRKAGFPLNDKFHFGNFVVGKYNQFAHAAATAVAEAPAQTKYNPLLIYGGTGLGKTHLAQAIVHYLNEHSPGKNALYATSERFTADFIKSLSDRTTNEFTTLYRSADVLLIDDIQFFSGKESTQEQFFHTFNDLFHSGKQLVLTSDRHPNDIKGLEERLLSRFASGLVADLQPPDLETRIAILRKSAEAEEVVIPEDVLYFVADNVTSNIRELEGCFTRLLAYASLEGSIIDHDFAVRVLGKEILGHKKDITTAHIQKKTAEFFHVDVEMMKAKKKTAPIAFARQVAMYLSRQHTNLSLKAIGDAFGGRDHSTVIHACDLITRKLESDIEFREKINALSATILC